MPYVAVIPLLAIQLLGLDIYMPIPEDNPLTAQKIAIGRDLFRDPLLSQNRIVSCATCHQPAHAFTDGRVVAAGVFGRAGTRNVPTLINRGYGLTQFLDGRSASLEDQVLKPIQDPNEMAMNLDEIISRLRHSRYRERFRRVFRRDVNAQDIARALASYVRSIKSGNAPIDHYANGDRNGLSPQARQGLALFRGKANCAACHHGSNFTDEHFHNTGIAWHDGSMRDPGRAAVTGSERDRGAFKTPTLREIARTAPYMHDGRFLTLEEVLEFYDRGGVSNPYLDPDIRPLHLTSAEKQALLTFLRSLNGTIREGLPQ